MKEGSKLFESWDEMWWMEKKYRRTMERTHDWKKSEWLESPIWKASCATADDDFERGKFEHWKYCATWYMILTTNETKLT